MERATVEAWVADYERAWRTPGSEVLAELFTPDATYLPSPWAQPLIGFDALAAFWDAERDGPDEQFTMTHQIVAVEGDTAVVRVAVDYAGDARWRDLWIMRFDASGRAVAFEEWPFAPVQRNGH